MVGSDCNETAFLEKMVICGPGYGCNEIVWLVMMALTFSRWLELRMILRCQC